MSETKMEIKTEETAERIIDLSNIGENAEAIAKDVGLDVETVIAVINGEIELFDVETV